MISLTEEQDFLIDNAEIFAGKIKETLENAKFEYKLYKKFSLLAKELFKTKFDPTKMKELVTNKDVPFGFVLVMLEEQIYATSKLLAMIDIGKVLKKEKRNNSKFAEFVDRLYAVAFMYFDLLEKLRDQFRKVAVEEAENNE